MEIRFSATRDLPEFDVLDIANKLDIGARITSVRCTQADACVRFTLFNRAFGTQTATPEQHDNVIRRLLELDPQATIRTARAVYEGLADYEAQLKARRVK